MKISFKLIGKNMDTEVSSELFDEVSSFLRDFIDFSIKVTRPIETKIVYLVVFKKYRDFHISGEGILKAFGKRSDALDYHRKFLYDILTRNQNTNFLRWSDGLEEAWNKAPVESFPSLYATKGTDNDPPSKLDVIIKDPAYKGDTVCCNTSFIWFGVFHLYIEEKQLY